MTAQHLYRTNSKYAENSSHYSEPAYAQSMKAISQLIRQRISSAASAKEAAIIAIKVAKEEELKRQKEATIAKTKEMRNIFSNALESLFKSWILSLDRSPESMLFRTEIVDTLREISKLPIVSSNPEIFKKTLKIITYLSSKDTIQAIELETGELSIFDQSDIIYSVDPAEIEQWDKEFFVKMMLKIMYQWSTEDLSEFSKHLSASIATISNNVIAVFKEHLFVPKFILSFNSSYEDWLEQLLSVIELVKLDSPRGDLALKAIVDFCNGKEDPKYQKSSYGEVTDTYDIINVAETQYKGLARGILGELGSKVFVELMAKLQKEATAEYSRKEKNLDKSNEQTGGDAAAKDLAFLKLTEILDNFKNEEGVIDVESVVVLIKAAIENNESNPEIQQLLSELCPHVAAMNKVVAARIMSKIDLLSKANIKVTQQLIHELSEALIIVKTTMTRQMIDASKRILVEKNALDQIEVLFSQVDMNVPYVCDSVLRIVKDSLEKIHENASVFFRLSLIETAVTKLNNSEKSKLSDEDSITKVGLVESFLRTISANGSIKSNLIGKTSNVSGAGIDSHILQKEDGSAYFQNIPGNEIVDNDIFVSEAAQVLNHETPKDFNSFIGVPILSDGKAIGTLSFVYSGSEPWDTLDFNYIGVSRCHSLYILHPWIDKFCV